MSSPLVMVTTSRPQQHQVQSYGATNTYENKNRGRMWWPQMQGCRSQWDRRGQAIAPLYDFDRSVDPNPTRGAD